MRVVRDYAAGVYARQKARDAGQIPVREMLEWRPFDVALHEEALAGFALDALRRPERGTAVARAESGKGGHFRPPWSAVAAAPRRHGELLDHETSDAVHGPQRLARLAAAQWRRRNGRGDYRIEVGFHSVAYFIRKDIDMARQNAMRRKRPFVRRPLYFQ